MTRSEKLRAIKHLKDIDRFCSNDPLGASVRYLASVVAALLNDIETNGERRERQEREVKEENKLIDEIGKDRY